MVVKLHNHQARSGQPVFLNKPTVTVRAHCRTDGLVYISTPEHELRPCRKMSLDRGNHQAGYGGPLLRCQNPQPTGEGPPVSDGPVYISTPEHELRSCRKMSLDGGNHQAGYGGPLLRCQNPQPTVKVRRYQMDWCTSVLLNTNYGRAAKCPSMAATTRLVMVVLSSAARTRSRR